MPSKITCLTLCDPLKQSNSDSKIQPEMKSKLVGKTLKQVGVITLGLNALETKWNGTFRGQFYFAFSLDLRAMLTGDRLHSFC